MTVWRHVARIPRNRSFQIGLGIYVLSLALRLAVLAELRNLPTFVQCTVLDMRGNHEFALAILQGLRPTTYYKAPFYSYFLAGVYAVAGTDPFNARLVQVFLTSLTPVLTFLIGQRLFGRTAGAIAGLLSAFFWTFLYFSVELLDTGLACLLYMLLAWLLLILDDRRKSKWLLCGLVLGVGAITRPNILAFAPILAVMVFIITWRRRIGGGFDPDERRVSGLGSRLSGDSERPGGADSPYSPSGSDIPPTPAIPGSAGPSPSPETRRPAWRLALTNVLALTIGCCLPIAPVTLRNRIVGGEWVLLGAYGGMNLYVANNPHSDSKNGPLLIDDCNFVEPTTWDPNEVWARCCLNYYTAYRVAETKLGRPPKPGEFAGVVGQMAEDFIRDNPGWFARHALRRLCWLFNTFEFPSNRNLYDFRQYSRVLTAASVLQFGVICPLALLGLGLAMGRVQYRTAGMAYYLGLLASLIFPAVLFHINVRFRVPVVHVLMPFAAYGLLEVIGLFRPGVTWGRRLATGGVLSGLAVFSNSNLFDYWDARGAHLQWAMLTACEEAAREDLLPKAVEDFEKAMAEFGDTSRPSDTSLVMKYGRPMAKLFRYYNQRGNVPKALTYASLMLKREPISPAATVDAFNLFMRFGDQEGAAKVLRVMTDAMDRQMPRALVADCLTGYGRRFNDRAALVRAAGLYEGLSRLRPTEVRFYRALTEIQQFLQNTATSAISRPVTTTRAGP